MGYLDIAADFKQLARYYLSLMEGDTHLIEDAYALMRKYKLVNESGLEINEEDE